MSMTIKQVQQALANLGWPIAVDGDLGPQTHEATRQFQRGFAFWDLQIDGWVGPQTEAAIHHAFGSGHGTCSQHFSFIEFRSKGNGWIELRRELVRGLEKLRVIQGPIGIVSGYRDPAHNKKVGGASNSQHLYGNGADIDPKVHYTAVRKLQVFSGIGYDGSTGRVRHVDVRHLGPNPTGGSPTNPTIWRY